MDRWTEENHLDGNAGRERQAAANHNMIVCNRLQPIAQMPLVSPDHS